MEDDNLPKPTGNDLPAPAPIDPTPPPAYPENQQNYQPSSTQELQPISGSELQKAGKKRRRALSGVVAIIVVLLVGGSAAAYFGYILPNRPENVWKKALTNTAEGYDGLVSYAEEIKDISGFKAKGKLKLEGIVAGDGSIEMHGDKKNTTIKADIGFAGTRYTIDALAAIPEGAETPDLYLKLGGVRGLGDLLAGSPYESLGPAINQMDGQWMFIDHTLFDQLASRTSTGGQASLSREDMIEIARTAGEVNREYLFSTNPEKRVFLVAEQVGKEERDGRSVYHYKAGYDKDNLKKYVTALKERLKNTKIKSMLEASGQSYDDAFNVDDTMRKIDGMQGDETADVWVDMKTKLVRYVRFTDKENNNTYIEIGVPYNGGNEVPFSLSYQSGGEEQGKIKLSLTVNTDTHVAVLKLDSSLVSEGRKQAVLGDLTFEPSDQAVEFMRPADAKPIMEVIGALYSGVLDGTNLPQPQTLPLDSQLDEIEL